ncbi:patatin-like phospholipase family protein [Azospirillum sp. TSO5]|uniref:patatin-like phospholipase family protein n=1 Tax=Azospirillum sp. TSO5 TaxID=716760 RepID=UPI000D61134A|nr:patatin-like phospholipase family protein [Azospirillum sp. TSO5]PWC86140.1 hypothetical protein TSO5_25485 [Azospirillum sp. TSO5]
MKKRILSIDGGGIRGVIALEVLKKVEAHLRAIQKDPALVLADYFDLIAGTSTGAIIASGLAVGMSVEELQGFYSENAAHIIFHRAWLGESLLYDTYSADGLESLLRGTFSDMTLRDPRIRTQLVIVARDATHDRPWIITTSPTSLYAHEHPALCCLDLPLWKLLRASTAAPSYFPPEAITVEGQEYVFTDGATTPFNNPAFKAFLVATSPEYGLRWGTGTDQLLVVSVGTGTLSTAMLGHKCSKLHDAHAIPVSMIAENSSYQDLLCRTFGDCVHGNPIDPIRRTMTDGAAVHPKLFRYLRYNIELSRGTLAEVGLADIEPSLLTLDAVEEIDNLRRIGRAVAREVRPTHFQERVLSEVSA